MKRCAVLLWHLGEGQAERACEQCGMDCCVTDQNSDLSTNQVALSVIDSALCWSPVVHGTHLCVHECFFVFFVEAQLIQSVRSFYVSSWEMAADKGGAPEKQSDTFNKNRLCLCDYVRVSCFTSDTTHSNLLIKSIIFCLFLHCKCFVLQVNRITAG